MASQASPKAKVSEFINLKIEGEKLKERMKIKEREREREKERIWQKYGKYHRHLGTDGIPFVESGNTHIYNNCQSSQSSGLNRLSAVAMVTVPSFLLYCVCVCVCGR